MAHAGKYQANGKQVIFVKDGDGPAGNVMHIADAVDPNHAVNIVEALNKLIAAQNLGTPVEGSYSRLAARTAADPWHQPSVVDEDFLVRTLFDFVNSAMALDRFKAKMFYGKKFDEPLERLQNHHAFLVNVHSTKRIHAVLGIASEAGEFVERLLKEMQGLRGEGFWEETVANYAEEQGDMDWFQELLASTPGMASVEDARRANIAKLAKRFPDKFTSEAAIARADKRTGDVWADKSDT